MRPAYLVLALSTLAPAALSQTVLHTFNETEAGAWAGASVAIWTDVNGDGYPEWAVGAPRQDSTGIDAGRVTVLSGIDHSVYHVFDGSAAGDNYGQCVANAGDLNGDGKDDLVVGAPVARTATVYSGQDLSVLYTFSEPGADRFGFAAAGAGDVDADGHDDVIVGAYRALGDVGQIWVYSGQTGLQLFTYTDPVFQWLGYAVSTAGDVNADGFADVVAGAPNTDQEFGQEGGAVVLAGPGGAVLHQHLPIGIDVRGMELGNSVAPAGDIDGDGFDDYALGAPWYGALHYIDDNWVGVFSGATHAELWRATGPSNTLFGFAMASAGDVDFDGVPDLLVGNPFASDVHVFSPARDEQLMIIDGQPAEYFGSAVAGGGDVNQDGFPDFVYGASHDDNPTSDSGAATLFTWGCWDAAAYNYCAAVPNSSGQAASMGWGGQTSIATNNFRLTVSNLPPGPTHTGIFIVSADPDETPLGNGNLCLGAQTLGFIVRLAGYASDFQGSASVFLDLTTTDYPGFAITSGSTWFFQAWFRDFVGAGFNLSDGLRVTFCP